jgi:hypothetical protein
MKRVIVCTVVILLAFAASLAAQVPDHFAIVERVDRAHPQLIAQNTRESVTEFMRIVVPELAKVDPNWGYLSKSTGENGIEIPGFGRVSIDAVAYRGVRTIVDIISSAGDGPGTGRIGWGPTDERRDSNLWVPVATSPPPPPPPAGDDLRGLLEELRAELDAAYQEQTVVVLRALAELRAELEATNTASVEIRDLLRQLVSRPWPTYTTRLFGQPVTLTPR